MSIKLSAFVKSLTQYCSHCDKTRFVWSFKQGYSHCRRCVKVERAAGVPHLI